MSASPGEERLVLECHGSRIGIRFHAPITLARLAPSLPPGWRPAMAQAETWFSLHHSRESGSHALDADGRRIATGDTLEEILDVLESQLHIEVALRAPDRLFVHAGVVGWRDRVIVVPGRSRSGKTTLVEALLRAGASYFSDEYAVIDALGYVHPYPKALSLRTAGSARTRRVSAEQIGSPSATAPLPVGLVTATTYRPDGRWEPEALTAGEALLAMLDNTVLARIRPAFTLDVLATAVRGIPALRGIRGEAGETAAQLLHFMDLTFSSTPR